MARDYFAQRSPSAQRKTDARARSASSFAARSHYAGLQPGEFNSNTSVLRFAQRSGYTFGAPKKNREEKINSPPGLELGVVVSKLFETVIKRRALVPLSLR
jgi:hypothetical protein